MSNELKHVVIRFSGDSGDGMQLTGGQFSTTSALMGNDIATFPDFPAEIRAPQGTVAGVSGFQVNFGSTLIHTPGDMPDALVAMNPAALKANYKDVAPGGVIIVNTDAFTELNFKKAGLNGNPLESGELDDFKVIQAGITTQTLASLEHIDIDTKSKNRCKNFYALGMTYFLYSRDLAPTLQWIEEKFAKNENLKLANCTALKAGFNYAETVQAFATNYTVSKATGIGPGTYRQINGNKALAWGFIYATQNAGLELFLGSYPITPASDILHELSLHKNFGVTTFQAEDEIAAICSSIGASFTGKLGITTSSGPGIALKSEGLNLAIMMELPLVVIDVQRGGPSTGLPTKTEQSDLNMAMYGRNGESPCIVLAASTPCDCFTMAFEATRLSLEHMTPVILLTDGYIANGSTPWKLPDLDKDFKKIQTRKITQMENFSPYKRDPKSLVRPWAIPGTIGLEHRLGGLEKDYETGNVSYDPENHERMVLMRQEKVDLVKTNIPKQDVFGDTTGDLLLISWGGTYGATYSAVEELRAKGKKVSLMHLRYISPMPSNVGDILKGFKRIVVAELNNGQMLRMINASFPVHAFGYQKIKGRPFTIRELVGLLNKHLSEAANHE